MLSKRTALKFFIPGTIFMCLFLIVPVFKMLWDSMFEISFAGETFIGFENYKEMFTSDSFRKPLINTVIYVAVSVTAQFVLGFVMALLFNCEIKGTRVLRSFAITPIMLAPLVAGLTWKYMLSAEFGIINHYLVKIGILESAKDILWLSNPKIALFSCCIAEIWHATPFMMLLLTAGLSTLDSNMIEAAKIDGVNKIQMLFQVMIPNLKFIILTAISIRIVDAARAFDITQILTEGGPNSSSELLGTLIYKQFTKYNNVGYASAISVVFIFVLIVFTIMCMQSLWNPKKKGR